ncbi:META domain-containing protein [Leucobacter sp. USHLN153]|uniref:META domain-containing protein n=1 Tax=Leucobacter sp. USHLN153 TaxID=3081268 RepID=UPI0030162278
MSDARGRRFAAVALLGAAMLLSGCSAAGEVGEAGSGKSASESEKGGTVSIGQADLIGTWKSDEKGNPHLTFTEDGKVQGSDGCNGISTTYKIDGDRVALEPFVSTLRACPGVDDWLRGVRELEFSGDALSVINGDGQSVGTLHKAADEE